MAERSDPDASEATLRALQARLDRAADAAERLLADAGGPSVSPTDDPAAEAPPIRGWQRTDAGGAAGDRSWIAAGDAELLVAAVGLVRDRIPADLQRRIAEALREFLLAMRALLDWCLERAERRSTEPVEVQDIPIA